VTARGLLAAIFCSVAAGAWAGANLESPQEHNPDEGPHYFGFVKDERGNPVRDAKVTASYKTSLSMVSRTNATGGYRLGGFKKTIDPSEVTISCSKDGYKTIRVFRRPAVKGRPIRAVETECRLQRQ
jgi:hypothetical protein